MKTRRITADGIHLPIIAGLLLIVASCSVRPGTVDFQLNEIPPLADPADAPVNIILVIGDGMGPEQVKAGGLWIHGTEGSLSFENTADFPVAVSMGTSNVRGNVTDSAASATAMATGRKVDNGVLSMNIPGDSGNLVTLAELARRTGRAIGLVTTDSVYSATAAAFAVHHESRGDYAAIDDKMMAFRPEVLFGGGKDLTGGISPGITAVESASYTHILETGSALASHDPASFPVYGRFGDDIMPYAASRSASLPDLDEMAGKALDILDADPEGFFLVIENELTDEASHLNDTAKMVEEVEALDRTVEVVLAWASGRNDTLVIVTADHETGGLAISSGTAAGIVPAAEWSTTGHTARDVMLYALGPDSSTFLLVKENVDIFRIVSRYFD